MRYLIFVFAVIILASCSAPRMSSVPTRKTERYVTVSTYKVAEEKVVASADPEQQIVAVIAPEVPVAVPQVQVVKSKKVKALTRKLVNHRYDSPYPEGLDEDLKWSIVLGTAGLVAIILMVISQLFGIIGGILLIAGVVMFAKWFLRQ